MLCFADYYGLSSKKRDLRWERGNNLLGNGEQGKCCRKRDEKGENDRRCHRPAVLLLQRAREEEDGEEATEMVQMIKKKKKSDSIKAVVEKGTELIYLFYPHMN